MASVNQITVESNYNSRVSEDERQPHNKAISAAEVLVRDVHNTFTFGAFLDAST